MIENQERAARDTIRVAGPQTTFIKWSGFALVLWALHLLIRDFTFAFTHGSTEGAMGRTFLGLDGLLYAAVWTPFPLLASLDLLAFTSGLRHGSAPSVRQVSWAHSLAWRCRSSRP